jgi:hypothetical protein
MARWNRPSKTLRDEYLEVERRMTALKVRLSGPPGLYTPTTGCAEPCPTAELLRWLDWADLRPASRSGSAVTRSDWLMTPAPSRSKLTAR